MKGNCWFVFRIVHVTTTTRLWPVRFVKTKQIFRWRIRTMFSTFWSSKVKLNLKRSKFFIHWNDLFFFCSQGFWTREDFRQFLNKLFSNKQRPYLILSDKIDEYFSDTDFNRDGRITYDEFIQAWKEPIRCVTNLNFVYLKKILFSLLGCTTHQCTRHCRCSKRFYLGFISTSFLSCESSRFEFE